MKVIFATLFVMIACQAIADEPKKSKNEEIGRYAISGDWRLDTKTGYVDKLSVIYDRQMRLAAKEIEAETGHHVVSVEGHTVSSLPRSFYSWQQPPSVIRPIRPEDKPVTRAEFDALRVMTLRFR